MILIVAHTQLQRDLAHNALGGGLSKYITDWMDRLLMTQAMFEAAIDYSDEISDDEVIPKSQTIDKIHEMEAEMQLALDGFNFGKRIVDGIKLLIMGPPNAGKSSLFNQLLTKDRSLVSHTAGTTRDYLDAQWEFDGIPVTLLDTAGLRQTTDPIETEGIKKALELIPEADIILSLGSHDTPEPDLKSWPYDVIAQHHDIMWIWNKSDEQEQSENWPPQKDMASLSVHCLDAEGIEPLKEAIRKRLKSGSISDGCLLTHERHRHWVQLSLNALREGIEAYDNGMGEEILASFLFESRDHLGQVIGESTSEDILDKMFGHFCLGK